MFGTTGHEIAKTNTWWDSKSLYNVANENIHRVHLQTKWSRFEPLYFKKNSYSSIYPLCNFWLFSLKLIVAAIKTNTILINYSSNPEWQLYSVVSVTVFMSCCLLHASLVFFWNSWPSAVFSVASFLVLVGFGILRYFEKKVTADKCCSKTSTRKHIVMQQSQSCCSISVHCKSSKFKCTKVSN